ncbi:hypothetical protein [Natrarchaeobaculum sulfurireducens]|uniref:hypothetical protein n=1 Tax=Natrarchaeobaculum sulfurireducens TaxID=2044521 RepID=UPI00105AB0FE|nr:hypothetical protein [Natrarchaeobaculum sulfurireducens]
MDTVAVKESGNSSREIDGDGDNLVLTTTGNAQPTVTGTFETVFVESKGNSQPEIEGEIEQLYVDARGNAAPNIRGDVDKLTVVTKGNAHVGGVSSASEYTEVSEFNSQPVLDGSVEIRASGVAVDGLDIDTDAVGIDIWQGYGDTTSLSNNVVFGTDELVVEEDDVAVKGAGVQVRTAPETEEVSLGGAEEKNLFVGHW